MSATEITTMTATQILADLGARAGAADLPHLSRRTRLGEPMPIAWATAHDLGGSRARVQALTRAEAGEIARACEDLLTAMHRADLDRGCPLGRAAWMAALRGGAAGDVDRCRRACERRAAAA